DKFLTEASFEVKIAKHSLEEENLNWGKFSFGDFKEIRPFEEECDQLSKLANCTCRYHGRCVKGTAQNHLFACQSNKNASIWATSAVRGHYAKPVCPDGYYFSIPHNGLQHQQLVNVITGRDVWINLTPYIPLLI
ncbi:hypothetical protein pdam_00024923, partial [Pocillopora damicornis]